MGEVCLPPMNTRAFQQLPLLALLLGGFTFSFVDPPRAAAQQGDAVTEVFNLVNGVRAEYGLPPYTQNSALMVAAQSHSAWGASVGYFDHVQPDGSRPRDRAVRAGYGDYNAVRVSENIYYGTNASPQSAVQWWRNSAIHFAGMTSTQYQEIGVGVAYGDSGGYFTLVFGVKIADLPPPPPAASGSSGQQGGQAVVPPELDIPEIPEIATAAPNADGSITHTVEDGQAIWNIAAAYQVDVPTLLELNGLTDNSFIHAGNRILVRAASTPTPPPPTPRPPTLTPIVADRSGQSQASIGGAPVGEALHSEQGASAGRDTLRRVLIGALMAGVGMVLVGMVGLRVQR